MRTIFLFYQKEQTTINIIFSKRLEVYFVRSIGWLVFIVFYGLILVLNTKEYANIITEFAQ